MSTKAQEHLTSVTVGPLINRLCQGYNIPGSELQKLVERIKREEADAIEDFAGGTLDMLTGNTRAVMTEATALRYLLHQLETAGRQPDPAWVQRMEQPPDKEPERRSYIEVEDDLGIEEDYDEW